MPLDAGQQFRGRARKALEEGRPFEARGEVNKRILEEVRAEVEQGKAIVRDNARKGVKRIQEATATGEAQLRPWPHPWQLRQRDGRGAREPPTDEAAQVGRAGTVRLAAGCIEISPPSPLAPSVESCTSL